MLFPLFLLMSNFTLFAQSEGTYGNWNPVYYYQQPETYPADVVTCGVIVSFTTP